MDTSIILSFSFILFWSLLVSSSIGYFVFAQNGAEGQEGEEAEQATD